MALDYHGIPIERDHDVFHMVVNSCQVSNSCSWRWRESEVARLAMSFKSFGFKLNSRLRTLEDSEVYDLIVMKISWSHKHHLWPENPGNGWWWDGGSRTEWWSLWRANPHCPQLQFWKIQTTISISEEAQTDKDGLAFTYNDGDDDELSDFNWIMLLSCRLWV